MARQHQRWRGSLPAFENVERLLKTAVDGVSAAKANGRNCVASVQP